MIRNLTLLSAVLVGGCATGQATLPPTTPTPSEILAPIAAVITSGLTPVDYLGWAIPLIRQNCNNWFTGQIAGAQQNRFATTELSMLGAAAGTAGAFGGPYGAAAAGALGLLGASLNNAQANSNAGIDPVATYGLVKRIQQAWMATVPMPTSLADAYALVEDFAEKCQLPEIKLAVHDAVSTATVSTGFRVAPHFNDGYYRQVVLPPVITVGH